MVSLCFHPLFSVGEIAATERIVATDKGPPNAAGSDVIPGCLFKTDLLGACSSHGYSFSAMGSTDRTIPVREELSIYICGVLVFLSIYICGVLVFSPCFVMLCLMFCGVLVMLLNHKYQEKTHVSFFNQVFQ